MGAVPFISVGGVNGLVATVTSFACPGSVGAVGSVGVVSSVGVVGSVSVVIFMSSVGVVDSVGGVMCIGGSAAFLTSRRRLLESATPSSSGTDHFTVLPPVDAPPTSLDDLLTIGCSIVGSVLVL